MLKIVHMERHWTMQQVTHQDTVTAPNIKALTGRAMALSRGLMENNENIRSVMLSK